MEQWRPMPRAGFPFVVLLLAALRLATPAQAAEVDYQINLDAPRAQRDLLRHNLELYRWLDQTPLDSEFVDKLYRETPAEIRKLMATEGYYAADVRADIARDTDVWRIDIGVSAGARTHVVAVAIEFTGAIARDDADAQAQRAAIRAAWTLPSGAAFRQAEWEAAKRALLRSLLVKHYPRARLTQSEARVDPANARAALHIGVDSGPAIQFGEVTIEGLQRYPQRIVLDLNPVAAGAPYDQSQLLLLQNRLQDSGYFKSVDVQAQTDRLESTTAPVTVTVVEQERRRVGIGVGYSTDTGPRAKAEYHDANIRERGWRLKTGVEVDSIMYSVSAGLSFPQRARRRDSIATAFTHKDDQGEVLDTARVAATRLEQKHNHERAITVQYQHEAQEISGARGDIRQALTANVGWTWRRTDDLLYPRRGYFFQTQLGGAHKELAADRSFARVYAKSARFFPIATRGALMLRAEAGWVEADARVGIPSEFLFKTGGDQTVRGYPFQGLGVAEGNAIVGGRYLAVGGVEYTHWLTPKWGAAMFYDVGDAADDPAALAWVEGYGLGARWRSPVGPIHLDVAYGEAVAKYRVHFAMGFNF